ncbi:MAG: ABC transporter permease [Labilithrix sp.]|nr:ABC transporter permease [Labilithrix sp.]MCW5816471.1 ABC transporter permease [Labilithrix sp.]
MKRLLRRAAWSVFVVWATITLAFLVNNALPSDPARMIAGQQAPPAAVARIRKDLGLDRPLYVQYGLFVTRLVHFGPSADEDPAHATCGTLGPLHLDLGKSYQQRRPVTTILAERAPRTLLLAFGAAMVQAIIGVSAGVVAAANKRRTADRIAVGASLLGVSAPTFVIGLLLQYVFAVKLRLFPIDGYGETAGEHLASVVLPAITLGVFGAAYYTRIVRDEMIGELAQDYVRTARAKGLSRRAVLVRHALRNALVPIVTIFGLEVGTLVGGAIVTESVFRWPGIGSLSVNAMLDRDGPLIMGCVIVTSSVVVLSTLFVDLAYQLLDPRMRVASR